MPENRIPLSFCPKCGHGLDAHRAHRGNLLSLGCAGFPDSGSGRCGCRFLLQDASMCMYCEKPSYVRNRCRAHYARDWRAGLFKDKPPPPRYKSFPDQECPCGSSRRMRRGLCLSCMKRWQRAQQGAKSRSPVYEPQPKRRQREYTQGKAYGYAKEREAA